MTLEYIRLTKDFEEIKEYVQHKGDTLTGYKQTREKVSVRIEDILYFETVDGCVFAYTVECVYEIKGRLYQVEEKVNKRNICRASKTMLGQRGTYYFSQNRIERTFICQNGKW